MITGSQIRGARGILKLSLKDLAQRTGVSLPTIQRLEQADGVPVTKVQTLAAIQKAIEDEGLEFIGTPEKGAGVRFKLD
jgi:transcriptional regulator with XRE-family HTH domain